MEFLEYYLNYSLKHSESPLLPGTRTLSQLSRYRLSFVSQNRSPTDREEFANLFDESVTFAQLLISTCIHTVADRLSFDSLLTLSSFYIATSCKYAKKNHAVSDSLVTHLCQF